MAWFFKTTGNKCKKSYLLIVISLHIRSMWETTVMHKQVSGWTVNFGPNFPESPFLELKTRKPPPPISENFRFGMTKVYSGIPPISENFRFGMTKVYSGIPPISENFRFGMTKVYSGIPPHFGKLQIWDDQSLLWNTPPFRKTSDLGWPKFTPEYPPPLSENFRFGMTKVYSGIPLPNENCQIVQVWEFQNTESYYMWRLYPTRITTSLYITTQHKLFHLQGKRDHHHTLLSEFSRFRFS